MTPRGIADLFAQMEVRLIRSLRRRLSAHKADERRREMQWPAWQAEKLRSIRQYQRANRSIVGEYAGAIDQEAERLLQEEYAAGAAQADREAAAAGMDTAADSPRFFGVNSKKLNSLIEEITGGLHNAESAALRTMDDVYRRTLYRAELEFASGSVTLPQAVDMAVRDFLAAGVNCIEYSDGRRVNIVSYAEMALRTAGLRAYLRGEAERRKAYGVDTVLVSQYGACSDTCLPWQGRVYIDDVWGAFDGETAGDMGRSVNGKWYPLLSFAVAAGLFHPNCRHTLSTWFEGVSRMPAPLDTGRIREASRLERKQRELERKVRRYKRLAEGTQDPDKANGYRRKVRNAQAELRGFIADNSDVLRRDYWREKVYTAPQKDGTILSDKPLTLSEFRQYTQERMGINDLDVKELSVEGVTKTMKHIEAVYADFPQLHGYVIGLGQTVPDLKSVPMSTHPEDDLSGVTLNFNPKMYRNISQLKTRYAKQVEKGASPAGTSWEHIGLHEMGHVAEGYIIRHRYTELADMERDWVGCITASEIIRAAAKTLSDSAADLTETRKRLSIYALQSESETLAEAFCDYYANGSNAQPFSHAIMKEVRRWLK